MENSVGFGNRVSHFIGFRISQSPSRCNDDPKTKGDGLMRRQHKIKFLLSLAENFLTQRVGGKQPISAGMPIGWISDIPGVIQETNTDVFAVFFAGKSTPFCPHSPSRISGLAFAIAIKSGCDLSGLDAFCDLTVI